jgi:flagellar basal body-associated protein FliL
MSGSEDDVEVKDEPEVWQMILVGAGAFILLIAIIWLLAWFFSEPKKKKNKKED